ncbi:hypothetical protein ACFLUD_04360, partial [Chloroflexota bacterium]
ASHTIKIQWRTNNSASQTEAFIKNANIIAIQIDTTESYSDGGHTTVWGNVADPYDSGTQTAYLWAHGLRPNKTYAIGYYDGGGSKVATDSGSSSSYGNFSSQRVLTTDPFATEGTWHAVVFDAEDGSPADNYAACSGAAGYVVEDSFEVGPSAIPEFPTVMAGIAVAGMCGAIYYWMKKRRLYIYVKA